MTDLRRATLAVMATALVVRVAYACWNVPDYWGDAYHNWYISQLTLEHGGVLTDYKGRAVVWEPLYRYLAVLVTAITGGAGLWPGRVVSLLASVATCGLVTVIAARLCGTVAWGAGAGVTLALTPWHVAFGWMYMPEATAGLLVTAALAVLVTDARPIWLVPLAALGVVTRHDVTVLLALAAIWLAVRGRRSDAALITIGMVAGLGLWSLSTWIAAGDPLIWLTRRLAGSADNAARAGADGLRPAARPWTVPFMLLQVYAPVLVLLAATVAGWRDRAWRAVARPGALLWVLGIGFTAVMAVMTVRFFSYPDPRYVLVLAPIGAVLSMLALRGLPAPARVVRWHAALVLVSLAVQLPTFTFRAWVLAQDRAVGAVLGAQAAVGRLIVDAPAAIYASGLAPDRFRASGQLLERVPPGENARSVVLRRMRQLDVQWVYAFEAPFSSVLDIFPEMRVDTAFVADGVRFRQVYRYRAWQPAGGGRPWWGPVRARIERGRDGGAIWRLERAP